MAFVSPPLLPTSMRPSRTALRMCSPQPDAQDAVPTNQKPEKSNSNTADDSSKDFSEQQVAKMKKMRNLMWSNRKVSAKRAFHTAITEDRLSDHVTCCVTHRETMQYTQGS